MVPRRRQGVNLIAGVAERLQEAFARLGFASRPCQVEHECMLRTDMVDNEWTDLAIIHEPMGSQASRTQQLRQRVF